MSETYFFSDNLEALITEIPPNSIISRAFHEADRLKAILFGFAPGQELTEHTSAKPAILHFLKGEAELKLGDDLTTVQAGSWAYMQAHLAHSIVAKSQVIMLLYLL